MHQSALCVTILLCLSTLNAHRVLQNLPDWNSMVEPTNGRVFTSSNSNNSSPSYRSSTVTHYVTNGEFVLCSPGCSDCSSGACTACLTGFAFNSQTNFCSKCGPNCRTCTASSPTQCSGCLNGAYLSGTSCSPCDNMCVTCSGSSTNCTQCRGGFRWNGSSCVACPRNCRTCTSSGCTICSHGFTLNSGSSLCIGCSQKCASCSASDITTCTGCGSNTGLQLVNGSCVSCADTNCLSCSGSTCSLCKDGFQPNNNGTCLLRCRLPCRQCEQNKPTECTSCFRGFSIANGTCTFDNLCSNTSSCSDCGVGGNFYLITVNNNSSSSTTSNSTNSDTNATEPEVNTNSTDDQMPIDNSTASDSDNSSNSSNSSGSFACQACPSVQNCLQCDSSDTDRCSLCAYGYYLNSSSLCEACPTGCGRCESSRVCQACDPGYTLALSSTQGRCIQCASPCVTCRERQSLCLTCAAGHTKKGWKCQNDINLAFTLVFSSASVSDINSIINQVIERILTIMGQSTDKTEFVTIETITTGSTVVTGSYDEGESTTSDVVSSASTQLQTGLSSSSIGGHTVDSVSTTQNGGTTPTTTDTSSSDGNSINTGLIVGLTVGLTALLILVIIIIVIVSKRKNYPQMTDRGAPQSSENMNRAEATPQGNEYGYGNEKEQYLSEAQ